MLVTIQVSNSCRSGGEGEGGGWPGDTPFGVNLTVFASYGGCREAASLPAGASGCPRTTLFPLFARRRRRRAGDEKVGAQPQAPGQGLPPLTIPLKLTPKGDPLHP